MGGAFLLGSVLGGASTARYLLESKDVAPPPPQLEKTVEDKEETAQDSLFKCVLIKCAVAS